MLLLGKNLILIKNNMKQYIKNNFPCWAGLSRVKKNVNLIRLKLPISITERYHSWEYFISAFKFVLLFVYLREIEICSFGICVVPRIKILLS